MWEIMESHKERGMSLSLCDFLFEEVIMIYDVAVIGAGVVGGFIARELSRYQLDVCLIEKEADVSVGSSKANSGIVHAGYDAKYGSLKACLNVRGNDLMEIAALELAVPFKRTGSLVLAFDERDAAELAQLYQNGIKNGIKGLELLNGEQAARMEPNISDRVVGALHAPSAGIVCPYELTVGAVENAADNGVELMLETMVKDIGEVTGGFLIETEKSEIAARFIINSAGLYSDSIAAMVGEAGFTIRPRKGEYLLLDKSQGKMVNKVIFQTPSEAGKGVLVAPTADGNLLIGPNATDINDKGDTDTTESGLRQVLESALKSVPSIRTVDVITSFAGLRATPSTGDFIIGPTGTKGFINAAGIESPGLTAAPAIAEYVLKILESEGLELKEKENYNPYRKPVIRFRELSDAERHRLIMANPMYGNIVCRCEMVTEGEIVDSIRRSAGARSLDAVKRRTRSGMGRCQGGFCTPRLAAILARELGISPEEITKKGGRSKLLLGRTT